MDILTRITPCFYQEEWHELCHCDHYDIRYMIGYISLNLKISSIHWNDTRLKLHGVSLLYKPSDVQVGGKGCHPNKVFWYFSWTMKHQHLTFSVAVHLSLRRTSRQVKWWSVTMVTRYDVIRSRCSSNFWVKMMFFLTFFNNKNYLSMKWYKVRIYVLLYMSSTKNNHLSRFYVTYFLILGKIQDCGQDGGGSAWITSNLLVRSPQPKRLDSSILFSLVKLVFRLLASIYR